MHASPVVVSDAAVERVGAPVALEQRDGYGVAELVQLHLHIDIYTYTHIYLYQKASHSHTTTHGW